MKRLWWVVLVMMVGCAGYKKAIQEGKEIQAKGKVTSTYDEFTRSSVVSYEASAKIHSEMSDQKRMRLNLPLSFAFTLRAFKGSPDSTSSLTLSSYGSHDWRYLKCHDLVLLVDGASIPLQTEHDGSVGSVAGEVSISEVVSTKIDLPTLLVMAHAKELRGRLCADEFSLMPAQIATLQEYITQAGLTQPPASLP